jgi:hypothetical protein
MDKIEIISLSIFGLVLAISMLSIFQDDNRRQTALLFSLFTLIHTLAWGQSPGSGHYYLTAAMNDLFIIFVITHLRCTTKLTERLAIISFAFTVVNALSWLLWFNGVEPYITAYIAILLYLSAIVALLTWDGEEDGNYRLSGWLELFRVDNNKGIYAREKLPKEERY